MSFFTGALAGPRDRELEAEVEAELQSHLEEVRDSLIESGLGPAEAEERALARFGNFEHTFRECVAERQKGNDPMKATLIALVVVLAGALMFTVFRSRRILAEEAMAVAEMHQIAAVLEQEKAQKVPRPVVYSVGDTLKVSDLDGLLISEENLASTTVHVAEDGMALFPHLGWVEVHGKQREDLEAELNGRYEEIYSDLSQIIVQKF